MLFPNDIASSTIVIDRTKTYDLPDCSVLYVCIFISCFFNMCVF